MAAGPGGLDRQLAAHALRHRLQRTDEPEEDLVDLLSPFQPEHGHRLRPGRAQPEPGGDAEIAAAAAPQGPEQIRILIRGRAHDAPVGEHHLGLFHRVAAQPAVAHGEADAAAEQEDARANPHAAPVCHCQPVAPVSAAAASRAR